MSPQAVTRRLEEVSKLRELCIVLERAGKTLRPARSEEPDTPLKPRTDADR